MLRAIVVTNGKKTMTLVIQRHKQLEADPGDERAVCNAQNDRHNQGYMRLLIQPPSGISANQCQLPQRQVKHAKHSVHQRKPSGQECRK
jgi:hypothetical protein